MNERKQNECLDDWINKCPMFKNYIDKQHNVIIYKGVNQLCEIDDVYYYFDFVLIGENKIRDSKGCHKKMDSQIAKFKCYKNFIGRSLGLYNGQPVHFFYAHFENDKLHVEYEGVKK